MKVDHIDNINVVPFSFSITIHVLLIRLFIESLLIYDVIANCHTAETKRSTESCEAPPASEWTMSGETHENALAVVLYEEDKILPMHKQERAFRYADHDILIQQDWQGLGVAAVVWDAAEVLCEYLETNADIVKGKSLLELGAGTGLVGIVATLLGGMVTITDRAEVLDFMQTAVASNIPTELSGQATVMELDWTKPLDKPQPHYDIILGADIVYIEDVFEDLLRTLQKLTSSNTVILLACRIRYDRDTDFLSRLEKYFLVEKVLYDKGRDVNLYKVVKK